jgi:hypothetical protein
LFGGSGQQQSLFTQPQQQVIKENSALFGSPARTTKKTE